MTIHPAAPTELAPRAAGALAVQADQDDWTDRQHAALSQLGLGEAPHGDLAVFLTYAQRTGLDPWARQIYMIGRYDSRSGGQKYTIQASIDGLRIVAQRSGDYAGQVGPEWCGPDGAWRDVWLSDGPPAAARVGVLRRGWAQPQYAVAIFREYASTTRQGLTSMWASKPALMIAKCAEALALRKAFPQDLSGIYTSDEMARADEPDVVTPDGQRVAPTNPGAAAVAARRAAVTTAARAASQGAGGPVADDHAPTPGIITRPPAERPAVDGQALATATKVAGDALLTADGALLRRTYTEGNQRGLLPIDVAAVLSDLDRERLDLAGAARVELGRLLQATAGWVARQEAAVRWEDLETPPGPQPSTPAAEPAPQDEPLDAVQVEPPLDEAA